MSLPALTVLSRPLGDEPAQTLPLVGEALPVPPGRTGVYISEAVVDLYGLRPGMEWPALSKAFSAQALENHAPTAIFYIAGIWRDYARQTGAVAALSLPENRGKIALFGGVKNARFRRQVVPGDVLTLECELVEQHGPVGIGKATAWVDGVRAANAELTFVITDA